MKTPENEFDPNLIRQKAEELLEKGTLRSGSPLSEAESQKMIHELAVHQIELEIQKDELIRSKEEIETVKNKYVELYDFAPIGYITLSIEGEILELNLSAANLLGKERSYLITRRFQKFITAETKPIFNLFLEKIFNSKLQETCEIVLSENGSLLKHVHLTGIISEDGKQCFISMADITKRKFAELTVKESEEKFRLISQLSPTGIYLTTPKGECRFVNERWCKMAGLTIDEALGFGWINGIHPDDRQQVSDNWNRMVESKGTWGNEYRFQNKEGVITWVYGLAVPQTDSQNNIIGYIGVNNDITEAKKAKDILMNSENKHRQMVANISDVIGIIGLDGIMKYKSPNIEKWFGWQPEDLIGTDGWLTVHPDDHERIQKELFSLLEKDNSVKTVEYRYKCKDGSYKQIELTATNLSNDPIINGVLLNYHDITERKQAEELLRNSELRYRNLFEQANEGLLLLTIDGDIADLNDSFAMMHGYTVAELKIMNIKELDVLKEGTFENRAEIMRRLHNGEVVRFEAEHFHQDGHIINLNITTSIISIGDQQFFLAFHQDITERKKAEKELIIEKEKAEENEKKYRAIFDRSLVSILVADDKGNYKSANNSASKLLGYPVEEILKMNVGDLKTTDKPGAQERYLKYLETGEETGEFDFITKSKERKIAFYQATRIKEDFNLSMLVDITDRKKAELELIEANQKVVESEEKYRALFYNAPLSYQSLDENGCFIDINPMWLKTLGYERDEVIGKWYGDFLHPDFVEHFRINFPAFKKRGYVSNVQFKLRRKDNSFIHVSFEGCIGYTPEGKFKQTYCVFKDITEQKALEDAIIKAKERTEESEIRYHDLVSNINAGVVIHQADTSVLDCNKRASELLGLSEDQMKGKVAINPQWKFIYEKGTPIPLDDYPVMRIVNSKKAFYNQMLGVCRTAGDIVWLLVNGFPVLNENGEIAEIIISFIDITNIKNAEEALRKSEAIKNAMLSNIGDVIVIIDKDGMTRYKSPNITKLFGWEPEELIGKNTWDNVHPDDLDSSQKFLGTIFSEPNATGTAELRYKHKDGNYVWIEISVINLLHDKDIQGILGNYHDITERMLAEKELKINRELLSETESIGKVGGWSFNIDTMALKWTDEVYHIHEVEISSNPSVDSGINYYTEESKPIIDKAVQRAIKYGENFDLELEIITAKGNTRAVHTIGKADLINRRIYGFFQDITDRKLAEKQLKESEEKFKSLMQQSPFVVELYDLTGLQVYVNKAYEELWNFPAETTLNKFNLLESKEVEETGLLEFVKIAYAGDSVVVPEYKFDPTGDTEAKGVGRKRWLSTRIYPLKDGSGKVKNIVIVHQDITERKHAEIELEKHKNHLEELVKVRTEELESANESLKKVVDKEKELNEMKSRFISTTSHEFRTPLTAVLSSTQLLQRFGKKWNDEKKSEHFNRIITSVDYLTHLLDDILTLNRSESGKITYNPEKMDLKAFADDCLLDAKTLITEKHELKFNYKLRQKDLSLDPKLMKFIFNNLLSNAAKYSPDGGKIEMVISKDKKTLVIEVRDEGIGIPTEDLDKIFDSFYRTKHGENIAGTGLGLAIVKRAVELHSGDITATSELNKGTTFTVKIPIVSSVK